MIASYLAPTAACSTTGAAAFTPTMGTWPRLSTSAAARFRRATFSAFASSVSAEVGPEIIINFGIDNLTLRSQNSTRRTRTQRKV